MHGRGCLRFAFYGRVSTEDWQDPVTSRADRAWVHLLINLRRRGSQPLRLSVNIGVARLVASGRVVQGGYLRKFAMGGQGVGVVVTQHPQTTG